MKPLLPLCLSVVVALACGRPAMADGADKGQHFGSLGSFSMDLLETVRSMQEHVRMVSMTRDDEVRDALRDNGFTLEGDLIKGSILDGMRSYVVVRGSDLVIAFRGTKVERRPLQFLTNALTDANADLQRPNWFDPSAANYDDLKRMKMHHGISKEWKDVRNKVFERINRHPQKRIWVFGHSLGAGLGAVAALDIAAHTRRDVRYIGSGSPRVGNDRFREAFERAVPQSLRFVVGHDVVPRIPAVRDYEHAGRLLIVNTDGTLMNPDEIDTRPQLVAGWRPHDNAVYHALSQRLLEIVTRDPGSISRHRDLLTTAAEQEREVHRTLRERTIGRLFD